VSRERFKCVLKRKWGVRVHVVSSGFRCFGVGEAVAPEVNERLKVAPIGGFQRRKVGGATGVGVGFEYGAGEVEPAEQFAEEEADGATAEVVPCI